MPETQTSDLGLLIRDVIEDHVVKLYDWENGAEEIGEDWVENVDASDADNLVVTTESGAVFTIRIVRTG